MTPGSDHRDFDFFKRPVSRRGLLKGAAAVAGGFALGPVISACGGDSGGGVTGGGGDTGGSPKMGGTFKVGLPGGQGKDTVDPHIAPFAPDDAINWLMYDGLVQYSPAHKPELLLAEEITPDSDASVWTVRLKPDIPWQNGTMVSAGDVVFTFQRICDPDNPLDGASAMGGLKPENVKKVDDLTVTLTYDEPFVLFATDAVTQRLVHIVPADFDPKNPIGCGPFQLVDFKPSDQFTFTGFKGYHGGAPMLDEVTLIQLPEETARVNAFMSGAVDAIAELPHSQMTAVESADLSVEIICSEGVGAGSVASAQVLAENAKGAGVNVKVNKVDGGILWGDDYLTWPFSMDFWGLRNYLQQALSGSTPDAPYNETHWKNDTWYSLVKEALRTVDDDQRNALVGEAATIEHNEGGYIIPTFKNQLDAYTDKVGGIVTNDVMGIPLGRWRFREVYFK